MDLNSPPNPLSQIPPAAPLTKPHKHREYFFLAIAVVVIAAGIIWWQIGKLNEESQLITILPTMTPNPDDEEVRDINKDINNLDTGNLDAEFQQIDSDLDNL